MSKVKVIIEGARQTGKTTRLIEDIIETAHEPYKNITVLSPNIQMSKFLFQEVLEKMSPGLVGTVKYSPTREIALTSGSRIKFFLIENLIGIHCNHLFVDEATFIDQEMLSKVEEFVTDSVTETRLVEKNEGSGVLG